MIIRNLCLKEKKLKKTAGVVRSRRCPGWPKARVYFFGTGKRRESDGWWTFLRAKKYENLRKTPKPLKTRYPPPRKKLFAFPGCVFAQEPALCDGTERTRRPLTNLPVHRAIVGTTNWTDGLIWRQSGADWLKLGSLFFLPQAWCCA